MLKNELIKARQKRYLENKEKLTIYLEPTLQKQIRDLMPIYSRATFSEMVHLCIEYGRISLQNEAVEQGLFNCYKKS